MQSHLGRAATATATTTTVRHRRHRLRRRRNRITSIGTAATATATSRAATPTRAATAPPVPVRNSRCYSAVCTSIDSRRGRRRSHRWRRSRRRRTSRRRIERLRESGLRDRHRTFHGISRRCRCCLKHRWCFNHRVLGCRGTAGTVIVTPPSRHCCSEFRPRYTRTDLDNRLGDPFHRETRDVTVLKFTPVVSSCVICRVAEKICLELSCVIQSFFRLQTMTVCSVANIISTSQYDPAYDNITIIIVATYNIFSNA